MIRVWMPYPREFNRSKNVKLLSTTNKDYIISPDNYEHKSIYMEAKSIKDSAITFGYELELEVADHWFNFGPGKNIALSVNGVNADANGEINITSVTKATQDGNGKVIADTYATKTDVAALTTRVTTNETNIAKKANDSVVVKLTGNQTVAGVKTFSSSPKAPTASATSNDTTVATTAWVTSKFNALLTALEENV